MQETKSRKNTSEVPNQYSGKLDVLSEEAKEELLASMPFEPQLDVFSIEEYAKWVDYRLL